MKEKRFVKLWSENIPYSDDFQNKLVLEIIGVDSNVVYAFACWFNGCFQGCEGMNQDVAFRLAKRAQNKNQL